MELIYKEKKKVPEIVPDLSLSINTTGHGADNTMIKLIRDTDEVEALYLHNHPVFIPYNSKKHLQQDLCDQLIV